MPTGSGLGGWAEAVYTAGLEAPAEPGMIRNTITLSGALAVLLAAGCGNKGPLYLPEPDAPTEDAAVIEPASEPSVEEAD